MTGRDRFLDAASWLAIAAMCVAAVTLTLGLAVGYRPVAITTGSMDPWAPTGALVVAAPTDGADIEVGDVLVMEKPDDVLVTHRVIELLRVRDELVAVTQGDANEDPDPEPYVIRSSEMTGRFVIPNGGRLLIALNYRVVLLLVVTGAIATLAQTLLRFVWSDDTGDDEHDDGGASGDGSDTNASTVESDGEPTRRSSLAGKKKRVSTLPIASALVTLLMADASYALFTATATVDNNTFTVLNCTAADGITVQKGSLRNRTDGTVTQAISPVDPARAFLLFSVSSSRRDPGDQMVRGELTDATTISFERNSGDNRPKDIDIEWSVIEYACGVNVQRGTTAGNGGSTIDLPITTVDPGSSFATVSIAPTAAASTFGVDEMARAEVIGPNTVRIASGGLATDYTYGWQVVHFDEPGVATVQKASASLAMGVSTATLTLPTSVNMNNTFLITGVTFNSAGGQIGRQLVRATPTSGSTIEVTRLANTAPLDVSVQAITLTDGTLVHHGTVDIAGGSKVATAPLPSVDLTIATAMSTVNVPGSMSGGAAAYVSDDIVGEGSATFVVTDPTTLTVTRDSAKDIASFGWQVIEWAK